MDHGYVQYTVSRYVRIDLPYLSSYIMPNDDMFVNISSGLPFQLFNLNTIKFGPIAIQQYYSLRLLNSSTVIFESERIDMTSSEVTVGNLGLILLL